MYLYSVLVIETTLFPQDVQSPFLKILSNVFVSPQFSFFLFKF